MAGLMLRVASRALPQAKNSALPDHEALIEALMTAKLDTCPPTLATTHDAQGQSWFFIALEIGPLATTRWFLDHGARPDQTDSSGRCALEVVLQRAALQDEFDDHAADCPAILRALLTAGADPLAANSHGDTAESIARTLGVTLPV